MLIHFGVKPFLVFDGDYLPSKRGTEKERAAKRREAKAAGLEHLRMGRTAQAHQDLQKSIDVTPEMAKQLMDELDRAKIDFIVAPYEADSQLVYLEKRGVIDGIISEDSDMLVFGAKVLLTKLDQYGQCVSISRKDFTACKEVSFMGWTDDEFRWMSILSGCDYLAPIGNVGLKTAHRLIRKHKTVERVVKAIQFDGKSKVPTGYLDDFRKADLTFQHQWVFCPVAKCLVHITDLPSGITLDEMAYIGSEVAPELARKVARGQLNPHTKEPLFATARPPLRQHRILDKTARQVQTPDLKKHHSIESFFKPRRTPLAELDPNVFTPSPSQQRLLEQEREESTVTSVEARPRILDRAMTDIVRSQAARRALSELRPSARQTSPKRQRLCLESGDMFGIPSSARATAAQSRFFGGSSNAQSPSLRKGGRKVATQQTDVTIWSDDSIEEAMFQLEEKTRSVTKPPSKKLEVYCDAPPSVAKTEFEETNEFDSQTTAASVEKADWSQETIGGLEPAMPEGRAILASSTSPEEVALPEHTDTTKDHDPNYDDEQVAVKMTPIKPLPSTNEAQHVLLTNHEQAGSEDMLVPNSDSEEDLLVEPRRPSFGLDLGRFAFAG